MKFLSVITGFSLLAGSDSLNNGLGRSPQMGYSSWNDCASQVTEDRIKNATLALISTGLSAKGYTHVNVDEGWFKYRAEGSNQMVEDPAKFPNGMRALGDFIHSHNLSYGLYTSRGTCQCSTAQYSAVGSQGFEVEDVNWMVDAGMDYVKVDSCCNTDDDPDDAFSDYGKFRDALNVTNHPVFFSLCGWYSWYAPKGDELGNSWRISGDGTNWGALTTSINTNSELSQYARPGAWNDPDLLVGTGIGSNRGDDKCFDADTEIPQSLDWYMTSDEQSRAQFTLWCVMSAPLLISANLNAVSDYALETWGNEEAIYVNQNFRDFPEGTPEEQKIYQGIRVAGQDLSYDKSSDTGSGTNVWAKPLPNGVWGMVFLNNENTETNVLCDNDCFKQLYDLDVSKSYIMRDLWAHEEIGVLKASEGGEFSYTTKDLGVHGGVLMITLTPQE